MPPRPPPVEPLSSDESSSSFNSITDAKKRIKALEREATDMQANFSQYRRYVTTQFHSPPTGRPEPAASSVSSSFGFARATASAPATRPEVPRKLLLTQYLVQDYKSPVSGFSYNNNNGGSSGAFREMSSTDSLGIKFRSCTFCYFSLITYFDHPSVTFPVCLDCFFYF